MFFIGLGLKNPITVVIMCILEETGRLGVFMEKDLIKHQNMLVDAGTGVLLFAIWNVAKVNLYLGLSLFPIEEVYEVAAQYEINAQFFLILIVAIIAVILLFQLGIRMFIGLAAIAEGKGKPKGWNYLLLAVFLLLTDLQTYWQAFDVDRIMAGEEISVDMIASLCMEAVSMYILVELIISGFRVKKLKK